MERNTIALALQISAIMVFFGVLAWYLDRADAASQTPLLVIFSIGATFFASWAVYGQTPIHSIVNEIAFTAKILFAVICSWNPLMAVRQFHLDNPEYLRTSINATLHRMAANSYRTITETKKKYGPIQVRWKDPRKADSENVMDAAETLEKIADAGKDHHHLADHTNGIFWSLLKLIFDWLEIRLPEPYFVTRKREVVEDEYRFLSWFLIGHVCLIVVVPVTYLYAMLKYAFEWSLGFLLFFGIGRLEMLVAR